MLQTRPPSARQVARDGLQTRRRGARTPRARTRNLGERSQLEREGWLHRDLQSTLPSVIARSRGLVHRGVARISVAALAVLLLWACGDDGRLTLTSNESITSTVDGRPYDVTVPSAYDPARPTPLVVVLHGYMTTAEVQDRYFKASVLAQTKNFLVALPNGVKDQLGNQMWHATDACCNFGGVEVDDVAYLRGVIADMKSHYNVDPKRVFLIGHSNGGFMAHRLACELSAEIAAIVSLAGMGWQDPSKCHPTDPVSVLQIHGDADETISYGGGTVFGSGPTFPGAVATVASWAAKNGCAETLTDDGHLDLVTDLDGEETRMARHACTSGAVELWTIEGGRHVPRLQPTSAERIYAFLEAHPKP